MAKKQPTRQDVPSAKKQQPTKVTLSLDSQPISLLWAHQLRRENKLLLDRFEALVAEVRDNEGQGSSTELAKAFAGIANATKSVAALQSELKASTENIQVLRSKQSGTEKTLESITQALASVEEIKDNLEGLRKDSENKLSGFEQKLDCCVHKDDFKTLADQVSDLDKRLVQLLEQENVLVRDSMERVGRLMRGERSLNGRCA